MSFSYYYTQICDQDSYDKDLGPHRNKELPANPWGWTIDPIGLRILLNEFYDRYQCPIYITENGIGYFDKLENGSIHDSYRIEYYRDHIRAMKEAIKDGVEVLGYTSWGPIDIVANTKCQVSKRYGYIYVDVHDDFSGTLARYPKKSFWWYQKVIATNGESLNDI